MKKLRATFLSNAGMLIESSGTTLLVDPLYEKTGHPFSPMPEELRRQIIDGQPPFRKIDYLLITHLHPDHFSETEIIKYLQNNSVRGIFIPAEAVQGTALGRLVEKKNIPCAMLSDQTEHAVYRPETGVTIRAKNRGHLDEQYKNVENYCYEIKLHDMNVFITADVDYVHNDFHDLEETMDVTFLNPLFFSELVNHRFYHGELPSRAFGIYHIPFAEDDVMKMRAFTRRSMDRWDKNSGLVTAFTTPLQSEVFYGS